MSCMVGIFLEHHRLELVLLFDQIEPLDDELALEAQAVRIIRHPRADVDLL